MTVAELLLECGVGGLNIGGFSFTERFVLGRGATNYEEGVILAKAQDGRKVALKIL